MFSHAIPRSLWEDKPDLTARLITQLVVPDAAAAGVNIVTSILVESFVNFSFVGTIVVGYCFGKLISFLCNVDSKKSFLGNSMALVLLATPMSLFNEGLHSNFSGRLLFNCVFVSFILFLFNAICNQSKKTLRRPIAEVVTTS